MINTINQQSLKDLMKQHGWTQKRLAASLKMSEQWLSELLNRPLEELTYAQIKQIVGVMGYNASILLQ